MTDLQALANQGVVGDLGTVFLRGDGDSESLQINSRSSGLPIEALKLIPKRICIALGGAKAAVIRAALLAGAITDLVVDDAAAELLTHDG